MGGTSKIKYQTSKPRSRKKQIGLEKRFISICFQALARTGGGILRLRSKSPLPCGRGLKCIISKCYKLQILDLEILDLEKNL